MPIGIIDLEAIVAELLARLRHGKVRGLVCKLLTDGLGSTPFSAAPGANWSRMRAPGANWRRFG